MKKFFIQLLVGIFISSFVCYLYLFLPNSYVSIDNKLRDYLFFIRGPIETTGNVAIVDIDEKSLQELGQWPWERYKVAKILQNLAEAGVGIVGMDIVFAEPDNSNPKKVLTDIGMPVSDQIPDYDQIFSQTVASTPTVLGYVFLMENDGFEQKEGPTVPAIFIERGKDEKEFLLEPYRPILNIPQAQQTAYTSGFFNTIPDGDSGIIRSVPIVMKYDFVVYPSLAFEMIRIAHEAQQVFVDYDPSIGTERVVLNEFNIPTDRFGRIFVNYRGPSKTFKYISALDIYNNSFNKEDIEGKFILLGTSAAGLLDLRAMPYDNVYPGVEIHANVIDNILKGDFISKPSWIVGADMALVIIISLLLSIILAFSSAFFSLFAITSFTAGILYFDYYMLFTKGLIFNILFPILSIFFIFIISTIINYFMETRQKNLIKGKFASKVSPAVMEDILKNTSGNVLSGTEREVTVFFSDVRNFTNISEAMPNAKTLIEFLNEYMDPMTDIIVKQKGTVDKFIGDAIMAYWNAPVDVQDHQDKAVTATLEQLHACSWINEKIKKDPRFVAVCEMSKNNGVEPIEIGIGLNCGVAVVGEMGSSGRSDYTVIGDPINLGARLESLCKFYNSKCNISNFVKEKLKGKYIYRFLDLVTVKGKKEPIEIWQIHDFDRDESLPKLYSVTRARLDEELNLYHKAIDLYKNANFIDALKIFKEVDSWSDKTNKYVYKMYIERCEHYIEVPPENFNGVFVHTTKG